MIPLRIVLVDDHPVVREGFAALLGTQPDLLVTAQTGDAVSALAAVAADPPDVVVTDLRMPGADGAQLIADLRSGTPDLPVMVLSTFGGAADVSAAVGAGATSYLLKDTPRRELFDAVRRTARGEAVFSPAVAAVLAQLHREPVGPRLSPREQEILRLVAQGSANPRIARQLRISEATVKTHLARLYAKLGASDRAEAVAIAYRRGLLDDEPPG